ncbi:MAG: DUF3500 domain-containing protein [Rhodothermales bacterium]|nr:DUF3500 domain-containing protein [Rhodothermales bacterium]
MKTSARLQVAAILAVLLYAAPARAQQPTPADTPQRMREAAQAFLAALDPALRERASFPFDDAERTNWFFVPIPGERKGLPIKDMTADQRQHTHALLRSALSHPGYLRATGVLMLERILADIEKNPAYRDPELYYLTVFGDPSGDEPWGWRFEGHHLSLNFSSISGEVALTPAFFGSNPGHIAEGMYTGFRLNGDIEDLARELVTALDADRRARAIITEKAPNDILTGNKRDASLETFDGLALTQLDAAARATLVQIVEAYAGNMEEDVAARAMARFNAVPADSVFFAWAGSTDVGQPHYYRIHTPSMLLEYDNTQNNGNHVHSVWRDLENDFGGDLLKRHYEEHSH